MRKEMFENDIGQSLEGTVIEKGDKIDLIILITDKTGEESILSKRRIGYKELLEIDEQWGLDALFERENGEEV